MAQRKKVSAKDPKVKKLLEVHKEYKGMQRTQQAKAIRRKLREIGYYISIDGAKFR